jgi:hypothetical protein
LLRARGPDSDPSWLPRVAVLVTGRVCSESGGNAVLEPVQDQDEIIERVAGLDIGKAELAACIRVPDPTRPGRRAQEVTGYSTMTAAVLRLADRLTALGVLRVVMEATSDYVRREGA